MASNKERDEVHKAIWSIADDLRGAVDGWDFKQYILGIMFYRYISENIANYINELQRNAGDKNFDYAKLSDSEALEAKDEIVRIKGFFIHPSELFCNVCKDAKNHKEDLNEILENIFNNIENSAKGAESEDDFAGLFEDIDVNSNKLGATVTKRNERLIKILDGINGLNLGDYQDNSIDAFGDAYEFLMTMYASNAGKSGGEFYTPQEVSELLTRLAVVGKTSVNKVYDPACGSGSLLLKASKVLGKDNVRNGFYGQEINLTTYNLCRINMFLHDIGYDKFNIACEDTLISPQHWDEEPFEVIVSNPPYSIKWAGDDNALLINDPRYSPAGVLAPKNNADYAFIMHSLSWLATNGVASIVCFPGILNRTNNKSEPKIRKYLVDNNYIDTIIQLPDNLFFGTSIATCIMVLKKSKKDNNILFVDASNECMKITNNNKMTEKNIQNIIDIVTERTDREHISKIISNQEISKNEYNLAVATYVIPEDTREKINIDELNDNIKTMVQKERKLREEIEETINKLISNKIDLIIKKECPNGVEYRKLEECCNILDRQRKPVTKSARVKGEYPYYGANGIQDYVSDYIFDGTFVLVGEDGSVITKNGNPVVTWAEGKIWVNNHAHVISEKEDVNLRYLYHYLQTVNVSSLIHGNIPKFNQGDFKNLMIAVPPFEVQCEIVHILDNFTLLSAELSAELKAREKQYVYYSEKLLSFDKSDKDEE